MAQRDEITHPFLEEKVTFGLVPHIQSRLPARQLRANQDYGQRMRFSVFECEVDPAQWTALRARLIGEADPKSDSLRFHHLGADAKRRVEHIGAREVLDLAGPVIFRPPRTPSGAPDAGGIAKWPRCRMINSLRPPPPSLSATNPRSVT